MTYFLSVFGMAVLSQVYVLEKIFVSRRLCKRNLDQLEIHEVVEALLCTKLGQNYFLTEKILLIQMGE